MASGASTSNALQPPGVFDGMQQDNPNDANSTILEQSTSCGTFLCKRLTESFLLAAVGGLALYCCLPVPCIVKGPLLGHLGTGFCCGLARLGASRSDGNQNSVYFPQTN